MMKESLLKAILSMDSYNRGYNAGIVFGSGGDSDAIIEVTSVGGYVVYDTMGDAAAKVAGFYAIAYENLTTHQVTISYRGTDKFSFNFTDEMASDTPDIFQAIGVTFTDQQKLAFEFFRAVNDTLAEGQTINVTGHSLGGKVAIKSSWF